MILFDSVSKTFGAGDARHAALNGVSFQIAAGEVFGVIGRSGAGKSTLVRLINRLERPSAGRVVVDGEDVASLDAAGLRALRRRVGMIFQHFNLLSSKTVAENVAFPLRLAGVKRAAPRVAELLERVGLADQAQKYPAQLSGGQKQRVGIARALATGPKILLCDEATSALDPETTEQVLDLLWDINQDLGLTVVLITHEMDVVRRVCHRVAVLEGGQVAEIGDVADVFLHPKSVAAQGLVAEADRDLGAPVVGAAGGPALRLTFLGEAAYEPVLGRVARETGVDYSILSGRIDRIRDHPYGQLVVSLVGGDAAEARRRLEAAGVRVEEAH